MLVRTGDKLEVRDVATNVATQYASIKQQMGQSVNYLKQSTATQHRAIGPFLDEDDGKTDETALTIANTDIKLWKNGASAFVNKNSGGAAYENNGFYGITFDATDTNTVGQMKMQIHVAGALPVFETFYVLEEAIYDSLFAGSASGFSSSGEVTLLAATQASIDAIETDTGTTLDAALATVDANVDAILADTADMQPKLGTPAGASISADIATVDANVDAILVDTGTTIPGTITTLQADTDDIQTRLPAALVGGKMDSDATAISGDTTAADNLESMYDGTGYTADDSAPASRAQVDGIGAASGAALNYEASSDNTSVAIKGVASVGTPTGTYANTEAEDGSVHSIAHATNDIDWIYGYNIGGGRTATELTFAGYLNSNNDAMLIQAYDFVGTAWDTIVQLPGKNGSTNDTITGSLLSKHTGTGADLGVVYIRFEADGAMTSPTLVVDKLLVAAVNIGQSVGYADGAIWVDSAGTAGTEAYVNGVADNPVSTFADALTINATLGLDRYRIAPGTSVTLAATINNSLLGGHGWTLALGGQDINECHVFDCSVSGIATAADEMEFHNCELGTCSLQKSHCYDCTFDGTASLTLAGDYHFINCQSGVAGAGSPAFSKTAGQAITAEFRRWSGGVTFSGIEATDTLTIGGELGTVTLNGADGTVEIRGTYKAIVDNRTGSPTLNIDGAIKGADVASILVDTAEIGAAGAGLTDLGGMSTAMKAEVNAEADTALTDYDPPTNAEMEARTLVAASYFDPAADTVANVTTVATTTTNTDMRGTDSAALASVATEARLAELDAANLPADVDTLLGRVTSTLFSGITSLAEWLGLMAGKQAADATALTEIKATGAGSGTYSEATDSLEAVRDNGDSAWITATGFSTLVATDIVSDGTALNTTAGVLDTVNLANTITTYTGNTVQTGDSFARLGSPVGASVSADVAAVKVDTAATLVDTGATIPASISALNDLSAAEVNAEVLDVVNVDTLVDGKTLTRAVAITAGVVAGKISGAGSGTETFVGIDGTTTAAVVTADGSGNRTGVTY